MNCRKAFQAENSMCKEEGCPEGGGRHCRTSAGGGGI